MTDRRDLKRRVRDRQALTGESYMTALRHVTSARASAVPVVELVDGSEIAAATGIRCAVRITPELAERVDAATMLVQLRDALIATVADPQLSLMRSVVLHGARPVMPTLASFGSYLQFAARVRAGIGGVSESGSALALTITGRCAAELVVFSLWLTPVAYVDRSPSLVVFGADTLTGPAYGWWLR